MSHYIGQDIGGYRIIEPIGSGGMARVFKAYQPAMDRFIALKILPEHYAEDETYLARFAQEAKIIAALEHTHILPVFDFGEDNGTTYLAMRYLRAGTLKDLLRDAPGGRLPLTDTARIIEQVADALDYAHQQGIIHRDVKPSNVMVDTNGDAFLMDFGIAKVLDETSHLTKTGGTLGTPAYMAPEQGMGGSVDARSDIYSLGIMLYQMLTGRVPYEADTPFAVIVAHEREPLTLPSTLNPDIPEEVERVIFKALAKNPDDRYQTAGALAAALEQTVNALGEEATWVNASTDLLGLSAGLADTKPSDEVTRDVRIAAKKKPKQHRGISPLALGAAVLVVITLVVIGGWLLNSANTRAANAQATAAVLDDMLMAPARTQTAEANASVTAHAEHNATATQEHFGQLLTATVITHTPPPTPSPSKVWTYQDMTVAFLHHDAEGHGWYIANTASFQETAEELGITLKFYDAQNDLESQRSAFRDFIADDEVDVIIFTPVESNGWNEVLEEAKEAGKYVIPQHYRVDEPEDLYTTYVGSDFVEEGRKAATAMCDLLEDSAKKNIVELVGSEGHYAAEERSQGFREKMGDCGITITQSKNGNWNFTEGKAVMEEFLMESMDIQGVYAQNDQMVFGAIEAIKEAGLRPGVDIKIVSIDAERQAVQAMIDGELNATVECSPMLAPQAYEAALKALNGEILPKFIPVLEEVFYATDGSEKLQEILASRRW